MAKQTYYFSHDGNARNDDRIIAVRLNHGMEGYGIYFAILERLLESSDFMSVKDYNIIAFDLRVSAALVKKIVEDYNLFSFTEDGKYFYSESFNRRMIPLEELRMKRSEAGKKGNSKRWNKQDDIAMRSQSDIEKSQRKENESKEEEISTNVDTKKEEEDERLRLEVEAKKEDQKKKLIAAKAATTKRKEEFRLSLVPFVDRYGKEMIRAFFEYWTEPNKSFTKMKYETEKTWDLALRLGTWCNRELRFKKVKVENNKLQSNIY